MTIDIARLKEAAEKATPGPWEWEDNWQSMHRKRLLSLAGRVVVNYEDYEGQWFNTEDDAAFIALANPTAILSLLSRLREAEEALDRAECAMADSQEMRNTPAHDDIRAHMEKHT